MCADLCLGGQGGGGVVKIRRRLASLKLSVSDRSKPGLLLQIVCLAIPDSDEQMTNTSLMTP